MEQPNDCASCKNLTPVVPNYSKLLAKFAIYKEKNNQNDKFISTFRKQNILMQALKEDLQDKNTALTDSLKKLKCLEVECSALRQTLKKEKEDGERQLTTKFKDSDLELQTLRNGLDKVNIELEAQKRANFQLSEKIDVEVTSKTVLQESFSVEKKLLLEKVAEAENLTSNFKRNLKHWSSLKDNRDELLRSVLATIRKEEKRNEAASLEANLLNSSDTGDLALDNSFNSGSDMSPFSTPQQNKAKGTCTVTDSSDDDFEEVTSKKTASPVKTVRRNGSSNNSSSGIKSDASDLLIEQTGNSSERCPKKSSLRKPSPRKASPRKECQKVSPRKALLQKDTPKKVCLNRTTLGKKGDIANSMTSVEVRDTSVVQLLELLSTKCDPMDSGKEVEERHEYVCLTPLQEGGPSRCGSLSPFPDTCLPGSESTLNPFGLGSSQHSKNTSDASVLCRVCGLLLSRCTPCQSVIHELSELKRSGEVQEKLTNGDRSPLREFTTDHEETGSLFSPPRHAGQKSGDKCVSEPLSVEKESPMAFDDSIIRPFKDTVGVQTISTSVRRTDIGTEAITTSSRSIGLQSDIAPAIGKRKSSRHTARTVSTTTQTEPFVTSEENIKCTLCDNRGESAVCPMKEFLKTSLHSVLEQSKFVSSLSMEEFFETSLRNLIKMFDLISSCPGVSNVYSSLRPVNVKPFYVAHPGLFSASGAPLYTMFNPDCFYPSDDLAHRIRNHHNLAFPSFKKEETSRANSDRSGGEEDLRSERSQNRSKVRSYLRKSFVCKEGLETHSRRTSRSPTLQSNTKENDSSDSSVEEIKVREGGTKRRLKNSRSPSKVVSNRRKKVKEFNKRDVASRSQTSELSGKNMESPIKKRYSKICRLSDSSSDEEQEIPDMKTSSPLSSDRDLMQEDQILTAGALLLQETSTQEDAQSVVSAEVIDNKVLPVQETDVRQETQTAVSTDLPSRLPPVVEKRNVLSTQKRRTQEETQVAVSTSLPLAVHKNSKNSRMFNKTLRSAKLAISFVSGGVVRSSNGIKALSDSSVIEPVSKSSTETLKVNNGAVHSASMRKDLPVTPHCVQGSKRSEARPTGKSVSSSAESETSKRKSTLATKGSPSVSWDVKSQVPELSQETLPAVKLMLACVQAEKPFKESIQPETGNMEGLLHPDYQVPVNNEKIKSPGKSPCLGAQKALAVLEDDLCLSDGSDDHMESNSDVTPLSKGNNERLDRISGKREEVVQEEAVGEKKKEVYVQEDSLVTETQTKEVSAKRELNVQASIKLLERESTEKEVGVSGNVLPKEAGESEAQSEVSSETCDNQESSVRISEDVVTLIPSEQESILTAADVFPKEGDGFEKQINGDSVRESGTEEDKDLEGQEEIAVCKSRASLTSMVVSEETELRIDLQKDVSEQQRQVSESISEVRQTNVQVGEKQESLVLISSPYLEGMKVVQEASESIYSLVDEATEGAPDTASVCKADQNVNLEDSVEETEGVQQKRKISLTVYDEIGDAEGKKQKLDISINTDRLQIDSAGENKNMVLSESPHRDVENDSSKEDNVANSFQEGKNNHDALNHLDAMEISGLVKIFPDYEGSAGDLCASTKEKNDFGTDHISSLFGLSDSEDDEDATEGDSGVSLEKLPSKGDGQDFQSILVTVATNTGEIDVNTVSNTNQANEAPVVGLFDDLEETAEVCVEDAMLEDIERKGENASFESDISELSRNYFGSLFEDLPETGPNLSGIVDVVAAVFLDSSEDPCVVKAVSLKMAVDECDTEGPSTSKERAVQEETMAISEIQQEATLSSGQEETQTSEVATVSPVGNWDKTDAKTVQSCSSAKPVPTASKRHITVPAVPTGPYRTGRTGRALPNQKNSAARKATTNCTVTAETFQGDTKSSGRRLRSKNAAKSSLPKKRKIVASREFVSSESSSESDSGRLVISEVVDDCPSGRSSPQDDSSGRNTPQYDSSGRHTPQDNSSGRSTDLDDLSCGSSSVVKNGKPKGDVSFGSTEAGIRTRLRSKNSPQTDSTSAKNSRYNTRLSANRRTLKSDSENVVNGDVSSEQDKTEETVEEIEKYLSKSDSPASSDEVSKDSPPRSTRRSGQNGRNAIPEPHRSWALRNRSKGDPSSLNRDSPNKDVEMEVAPQSLKADTPASPKRTTKLQKLRTNLSRVHPLMQKAPARTLEEPPLKKAKSERPEESRPANVATSTQMAKSGRTTFLILDDPSSLRRRRPKDLPKTTPQIGIPAMVFEKPRITPQERLVAHHPGSINGPAKAKEAAPESARQEFTLIEPSKIPKVSNSIPKVIKTTTFASILPKPRTTPQDRRAALRPAADTAQTKLTETGPESAEKIPASSEPQPLIKTQKSPRRIAQTISKTESDGLIFKRSNSLRNLPTNRPKVSETVVNPSILPLIPSLPGSPSNEFQDTFGVETVLSPRPCFSPNLSNTTISAGAVRSAVSSAEIIQKETDSSESLENTQTVFSELESKNATTKVATLPREPTSSSSPDFPCVPKRSHIWVEPATEMDTSDKSHRRREEPRNKCILLPPPVNEVQPVFVGRDLVAIIDSTPREDTHSNALIKSDRHPLILAWRQRGANVTFLSNHAGALADDMRNSVAAIRKLLNAYLSSAYFTEELLIRTVNSLLNPKYICVDVIVPRLMVDIVEVDYDSQPCIDTPGPGQFLTKIQQQLIALIMRLFPKYRSIVKDVLLLIEHRMFCLGQMTDQGRLPWLTVLHTSLCRIMKWRDASLIFCYDAMYCYVTRFSTILSSVFYVWPELLPNTIDSNTAGTIFQVMLHFIMTQGEQDKMPDLKTLRTLLVRKRILSGRTNSTELTQNIARRMKENKFGLISPELILISKREDIAWTQEHIVHQQLLPMLRDWLLNHETPGCPPLPPAAVLTLCGIVRAFRGSESSVSTTHTLMKTLLLDTKAVADFPDLEHAVCAGLVFLSRHNIEFVVEIVKKWQPRNECPQWLVDLLLSLMNHRARPPIWWSKEMRSLLDQVEVFPFTS